ncbi:MAG TPA: SDR family NAD(P)-dependent oxidoreductase [Micromonosporaceae bacterium]|nr:SDR family NAD(P)-dependent oxidoreductase [Micromonosporaceae bacterium]
MAAYLSGRRAVVTGGTRGVGRATSLALAREGASVLACYQRDDSAAAELAAHDEWATDRCHAVRADLRTAPGRARLVAAAREHLGGVDILVNNLGTYRPAALDALSAPDLTDSLHDNLTVHIVVTQALLGLLADGGAVVNIGAGMADRGRPEHVAFTAAKAGLAGFTRSLAKELAPRGIRVNTVAPGVVETERGIDLPPPVRASLLSAIPLRRFVTATDVADVVLFLASDLAVAVAGATVKVDGGI